MKQKFRREMMGTWPKRINRTEHARKMWTKFILLGKERLFLNFLFKLKVLNKSLKWKVIQEMQETVLPFHSPNREQRRGNIGHKSHTNSPKSIKPTGHRRF